MKHLLFLLTLFISFISFGQIMSDRTIDEEKVTPWNNTDKNNYEGSYQFGMSEGSSELIITVHNAIVCAQLRAYDWVEDVNGNLSGWQPTFLNYTNVRIEGNKFYSDESNGEFVIYNGNDQTTKGLKLANPPIQMGNDGAYEIGTRSPIELSTFYAGNYPQTNFEVLSENALNKLSLDALQIMRNEVYARYGYIFKAGGKMESYFKKQDWYKGFQKNVDACITEIEKMNLEAILKVEAIKKG